MNYEMKLQAASCTKNKSMGWTKTLENRSHATSRRWALRQKKLR